MIHKTVLAKQASGERYRRDNRGILLVTALRILFFDLKAWFPAMLAFGIGFGAQGPRPHGPHGLKGPIGPRAQRAHGPTVPPAHGPTGLRAHGPRAQGGKNSPQKSGKKSSKKFPPQGPYGSSEGVGILAFDLTAMPRLYEIWHMSLGIHGSVWNFMLGSVST